MSMTNHSTHPAPAEVALAFTEAFGNHDMTRVAGYVADDIVFESPRVRITGAEPFLETFTQFAQVVTRVTVLPVLGNDERAMIMYDMETAPFGTLRAVDHLVVREGRITSD